MNLQLATMILYARRQPRVIAFQSKDFSTGTNPMPPRIIYNLFTKEFYEVAGWRQELDLLHELIKLHSIYIFEWANKFKPDLFLSEIEQKQFVLQS